MSGSSVAARLVLLRERDRGVAGRAGTSVHQGDRIWWDLHDWSATDSIPAVVGLVPRAVRPRHRRPALADHARVRGRTPTRPASGSPPSSTRSASRPRRADRDGLRHRLAGRGRRDLARPARRARRDADRARPGVERRLRPLRRPERLLAAAARTRTATWSRTLRRGAGLIAATGQTATGTVWLITGTDAGRRVGGRGRADPGAAARPLRARRVQGDHDLPVPLEPAR